MRTWRNLRVGMWKVLLLRRTVWQFLRKLNKGSSCDLAFHFRVSPPKNWKTESRDSKRYLYTYGHSRQHYSRQPGVHGSWMDQPCGLFLQCNITQPYKPHSCNNMDDPWGHDAKCSKPDTEMQILRVYICQKTRVVSFIKTDGRVVVAKAGSKAGSYCSVGLEFQFGKMKFYRQIVLMVTKQSERTSYYWIVHLKIVKMGGKFYVLCTLPQLKKLVWYKERQSSFYRIGNEFPRLYSSVLIDHIFLKDFRCNFMYRL